MNYTYKIFTSNYYAMNSVVLLENERCIVIDPGITCDEIDSIQKYISNNNATNIELVFTHGDFDHIIAHHLIPYNKIMASSWLNNFEFMESRYKEWESFKRVNQFLVPDLKVLPKLSAISINNSFSINRDTIQFYEGRGHTRDSIIIYTPNTNVLIVGDYLSDIDIPIIEDSAKHYLETLRKIERFYQEFKPIVIPGHGTIIKDSESFTYRLKRDLEYLECLIDNDEEGLNNWFRIHKLNSHDNSSYHQSNVMKNTSKELDFDGLEA